MSIIQCGDDEIKVLKQEAIRITNSEKIILFVQEQLGDAFQIKYVTRGNKSFISYKDKCIYLNVSKPCDDYNVPIWNIETPFESMTMTLLHEIGHYKSNHEGKNPREIGDKWKKLIDRHEREAWIWAFEFRKNNNDRYRKLVEAVKKWYYSRSRFEYDFGLYDKKYERIEINQQELVKLLGEETYRLLNKFND